jgi:hypothetical protein
MAMSQRRRPIARWETLPFLVALLALVALWAPVVALADEPAREAMVNVARLEATARRAGLRIVAGERLVLVTDRPARAGDGVDDLPRIFDEAFASWCEHFSLDPKSAPSWRAFGCLMSDREVFRAAGLLPVDGTIPDFANGFCDRNRFWLVDPANPAYRRHLLLHEGVHAFTLTLRSLAAPTWYTEGIAELLATHRLEAGHFEPTPIPRRAEEVEQLGRIEALRRLRMSAAIPGLADVFATPPSPRHDIPAYATSWAATALLAGHPSHAERFRKLETGPLDARLTARLEASDGWDGERAARDFDAFTDDVDHGYDFSRSAIEWTDGRPLTRRATSVVAADRGWQPSGSSLKAGETAELVATGRAGVGRAGAIDLESTADGISLRWYRGRPLGRLLVAQWAVPAEGGRPRFVIIAEGATARFSAITTGALYLKLNAPPGDLAGFDGQIDVELTPVSAATPKQRRGDVR